MFLITSHLTPHPSLWPVSGCLQLFRHGSVLSPLHQHHNPKGKSPVLLNAANTTKSISTRQCAPPQQRFHPRQCTNPIRLLGVQHPGYKPPPTNSVSPTLSHAVVPSTQGGHPPSVPRPLRQRQLLPLSSASTARSHPKRHPKTSVHIVR
jgi:hypothetical protein